jgi:malate permease and related proteins
VFGQQCVWQTAGGGVLVWPARFLIGICPRSGTLFDFVGGRNLLSCAGLNELLIVLTAVLPVFGCLVMGFVLRRRDWLTADADQSLMRICLNLLLPALIFDSVVSNAALRRLENLLLPPLIGFGMVALGIVLARLLARTAGLQTKPEQRTFAFLAGQQNYAYLVIPLCISLFDSGTTGVLFVHNVGAEIAMWTVGVAMVTGSSLAGGWKKIFNAPLTALLLALALNFLGWYWPSPPAIATIGQMLLPAIHWLGQSAIPLALLLVGAIVADHFDAARGGRSVRVVSVASLLRLGLMPVLFILLAKHLPCSIEMKRVLVLQGAMPSAMLPIVLARHYGGDERIALQVALGTSVVGLVTIPLWIRYGGQLAGLW